MQRLITWLVIAAVVWATPVAAAPAAAPEAQSPASPTLNVTVGGGNPTDCTSATLHTALDQVQAAGGGQISFNCGAAPKTIVISPTLIVTSTIVIDGGHLGDITLSGNDQWQVIHVFPGGALNLLDTVVTLGGFYDGYGGCIQATTAVMTLSRVIVHDCRVGVAFAEDGTGGSIVQGSSAEGGAIANQGGIVNLVDSQVLSSTADTGGGIYNTGQLYLTNTRVAGNRSRYNGGGLQTGGKVLLDNSVFEHNRSDYGGGIYTFQTAQVNLQGSRIYSNTADIYGGGIASSGVLTMSQSSLEQNWSATDGGGLYVVTGTATLDQVQVLSNHAQSNGGGVFLLGRVLTLTQSLVDGNTASDAGGIMNNSGRATLLRVTISHNHADGDAGGFYEASGGGWSLLTNVTISGNEAESWGGGLKSATTLTMTNVTVANNLAGGNGGGFYRTGSGYQYAWRNVLLAGNDATVTGDNCYGPTPNSELASLSSDGTCGVSSLNATLPLGPLQVNGGLGGLLLPTHLLLPGNFAIDGGTNSGCPAIDERGLPRPINGVCDAGAVENNAVVPWLWVPLVLR